MIESAKHQSLLLRAGSRSPGACSARSAPTAPARTAAMASRASASARSLSAWPACPRNQCHRTRCLCESRIEPLPQVDILDRLLLGRAPAVALPLRHPGQDAVAQVLTVGMDVDQARPLERVERRDCGHELHAVVGGMRLAALELPHVRAGGQDRPPAARTRIARAGAVGMNDDVRLAHRALLSMP